MNIVPRVVSFDRPHPDWAMYADAAFDSGPHGARIAAIFPRTNKNPPRHISDVLLTGAPTPEELKFPPPTSAIFGMELIAIVLALYQARATLCNKAIVIYTDNNAALASLIKGDSAAPAAFSMIALFWFMAEAYNIAIWLERVDTMRNIADLPTRGVSLPFPVRGKRKFPNLGGALLFYNQNIAISAPPLGDLSLITPLLEGNTQAVFTSFSPECQYISDNATVKEMKLANSNVLLVCNDLGHPHTGDLMKKSRYATN